MNESLFYETEFRIKTPISSVWDALTNPDLTKHYMFGCRAISNWQIGSPLIWKGEADGIDYVEGIVVAYDVEKELSFTTFDPNSDSKDLPEHHLVSSYFLSEDGNETVIRVQQGDFNKVDNGKQRYEESKESWSMALEAFKKVLHA